MNAMQEQKSASHRPEMPSSRESFEYYQFNPVYNNKVANNDDNYYSNKCTDSSSASNMYRVDVNSNEMRLHSELISESASPAELMDRVNSSEQLLTFASQNKSAYKNNINQVKMKSRMMMDEVSTNKIRNKSNNNGVYTKIANDENTSDEVYSGPYSLRSS